MSQVSVHRSWCDHTFCIGDTAVHPYFASDIDDVISHVDQFLQSVVSFTYNLSRFQGLEDVKEDKVGVTEFFDMLGDLFTNGTIGHFEEEVCKQP